MVLNSLMNYKHSFTPTPTDITICGKCYLLYPHHSHLSPVTQFDFVHISEDLEM